MLGAALLATCCHSSDVGAACPQALRGQAAAEATDDASMSNTLDVVMQGTQLPCESLLCVASDGVDGYCSQKCRDDAGCPQGFACRRVDQIGAWSTTSFCTWKACQTREDCGGKAFCCRHVAGGNPDPAAKLCGFSQAGDCG